MCAGAHNFECYGNTAQFPPCGKAPLRQLRHGICVAKMLDKTSSIICAFGLASAAPRSPYRHLELCGIALGFIVLPKNSKRGASRTFNSSLLTPRSSLLPIKNMQLRNLTIPYAQPAVFAPMAGFTDAACRHLMADHGAAWTVSEMASAKAITFGDDKSVRLLRDKASHGIYAVQLFGAEPETMAQAIRIIQEKRRAV